MFRDNDEYDFMEDFQLKSSRPSVRYFVQHKLSLPDLNNSSP